MKGMTAMNIELNEINYAVQNNCDDFIRCSNNEYMNQINNLADDISKNRSEKPIILLSGPSGSGKTTTAMILGNTLNSRGIKTHTLSVDDYFSPLTEEEKQLMLTGNIDLESPSRVDGEFLSKQLNDIKNCIPVELPKYNFAESTREQSGRILHRQVGELVIVEGIHALNPDVVTLPDDELSKVYVSVRTRIIDGDITLHPSKIRLMRRLIRDKKFRRRSFTETLLMFSNVEAGENKYIMPYKYRSDYDVDTFFPYEICAYKQVLEHDIEYMEEIDGVGDAFTVLEHTAGLNADKIPPESLICEFIGNGQFEY
jgi:uridine kinase